MQRLYRLVAQQNALHYATSACSQTFAQRRHDNTKPSNLVNYLFQHLFQKYLYNLNGSRFNGGTMSDESDDNIVARCVKCKRLVFVMAGDRFKESAEWRKELAALIADGRSADHMTTEEVRKSDFGCRCK